MSSRTQPTVWFHGNRYHAQPACEFCGGTVRHQRWCLTIAPVVRYAYQIVADPSHLTLGDSLILHSLGVTWEGDRCQGNGLTK